MDFHQELNTAF